MDASESQRSIVALPKILFVVNDPAFFLSHRLAIAEGARSEGYEVGVATMDGPSVRDIEAAGLSHYSLPLTRSGRNPLKEMTIVVRLLRLFRAFRPDLVHLVTIKPVLYGGIAARLARVPAVVSAVSGLGFMFGKVHGLDERAAQVLVLRFYRWALGHPNQRVILQNMDDLTVLVRAGTLDSTKTVLIRGSGVDLSRFCASPEPSGTVVVAMAARLLKDKGVFEFVESARLLKERGANVRFQLIGLPDPGNPASVTAEQVREWAEEGVVECLGFRSDIAALFSQAHVIALPSYYGEGLPKVLIEAAASGRAVVTTDMPGCRDAIEPNVSGLLVPPRDAGALGDALQRLIEDRALRQRMGHAGRSLAEREFGIDKVVEAHLGIYRNLLGC